MDREVEFNTELTKIHHRNYIRNSRAVTVAWFIFCACYTILNVVCFIQPFWVGDTDESPGVGYFGLYEYCERVQGSEISCRGDFLDFTTILNDYFMASAFLVGGAALLFILSIICMLLFMFLKPATVLRICGWLQLIAAIFMAVACIIYPNSFDDPYFKRICGQNAGAYNMDKCQIRWAYILGIVLIFDALILSILAFILASCQAKHIPEMEKKEEVFMLLSAAAFKLENPRFLSFRKRQIDFDFADDDGFVNTAYEDTPVPDDITPRIVPQSLRHRQTTFQYNVPIKPITEPLVIPVDSFGDSSNESNPSSNRESERSQSLSLPKSGASPTSDTSITPRSGTMTVPGHYTELGDRDESRNEYTAHDQTNDIHL